MRTYIYKQTTNMHTHTHTYIYIYNSTRGNYSAFPKLIPYYLSQREGLESLLISFLIFGIHLSRKRAIHAHAYIYI